MPWYNFYTDKHTFQVILESKCIEVTDEDGLGVELSTADPETRKHIADFCIQISIPNDDSNLVREQSYHRGNLDLTKYQWKTTKLPGSNKMRPFFYGGMCKVFTGCVVITLILFSIIVTRRISFEVPQTQE